MISDMFTIINTIIFYPAMLVGWGAFALLYITLWLTFISIVTMGVTILVSWFRDVLNGSPRF